MAPHHSKWKWPSTILLLLTVSVTVRAGWYLDESCYDQSAMIQKAMSSAFDLIGAGESTLHRVTQSVDKNSPEPDKLSYDAQQDLVKYLFGNLVKNGKVDPNTEDYNDAITTLRKAHKFDQFQGLARSANIEPLRELMAKNSGKPYKPLPPPKTGVKVVPASEYRKRDTLFIYCNYDRMGPKGQNCFGEKAGKLPDGKTDRICDMAMNIVLPWSSSDDTCASSKTPMHKVIDMLTVQMGGAKWDPNDHSKLLQPKDKSPISSMVTICPSYLQKWSKMKIQTFADQGEQPAAARSKVSMLKIVGKKIDNYLEGGGKTDMDLYVTGDVTLVHEMTHAIFEYGLDDVKYGWDDSRELSDKNDPDNTRKPTNNADSFGYFCLGAKMISPTEPKVAQRPQKGGSISVLLPKGGQPAAKRETVPTTLKKVKRQDGQDVDAATSHGKGKASTSRHHSKGAKYTTVETVFTTVITEELTVPVGGEKTSSKVGGGGPGGKSSHHGDKPTSDHAHDTSSHHPGEKSTSHHGVETTSRHHKKSTSTRHVVGKSTSHHKDTSSHHGEKPTSHHAHDTSSHHVVGKSTSHHKDTSSHHGAKPTSRHGEGSSSHHASGKHTSHHGQTTKAPSSTPVQKTTIPVTSGQTSTDVVYIGARLPKPVNGDPLGWKCTGPLCDLSCSFPIICQGTGEGIWGLIKGWIPKLPGGGKPTPGGPSPPPKPDGDPDPNKSKPGEPSKSKPEHESSHRTERTSSHHTTSCKPRTTSICPVVATHSKGPDGKETSKKVTEPCKTTTLHDCTAKVHGSTSTVSVAAQLTLTPIEFADDFDDGVSDWVELRDTALAELVAEKTDPYVYPSATGAASHKSSKPGGKPTTKHATKSTSKPSLKSTTHSSKHVPKPSSKTASHTSKPKPKPKPSSTKPGGPEPTTTKYSQRCKNWSIKNNHSVEGTCTDKNGKEVTSQEDLGLCLYYNDAHMKPQNNGNIDKVCKYCFFNPPTAPDASSVWCVCQDSNDKSAYSVSSNLDDFLAVQDDGFVNCFGHISAPA